MDSDCLRPDLVGRFPLCRPDHGPKCCIGLTCERNPKRKNEYRCGNSYENKAGGRGADTGAVGGGDYDFHHVWGKYFEHLENQGQNRGRLGSSPDPLAQGLSSLCLALLAIGLAVLLIQALHRLRK